MISRPQGRAGFCLLFGMLMGVAPSTALGQRWQLDATAGGVGPDTAQLFGSASFTPALEWQRRTLFGRLSAGWSGFEGASWAVHSRAELSVVAEPFGLLHPVRFEVVGYGQATYHSSDFRTLTSRAEGRMHISRGRSGFWLGAVGGTGWASSDGNVLPAVGATAGAWTRAGPLQLVGLFSPIRLEGEWFPELAARVAVRAGPVDLDGYVGWRAAAGDVEDDAWGGGSAQIWLTRQLALVVSGGRYQNDLLQGLPGGRQLSAGIRLSRGRPDAPTQALFRPVYAETDEGFRGVRFAIDQEADSVEIAGEWTQWDPVPMRPSPGRPGVWEVVLDLPAGAYRFNLILDGERWIVPDGVMTVPDGYGGRVGLLVVP